MTSSKVNLSSAVYAFLGMGLDQYRKYEDYRAIAKTSVDQLK